jgi:hypothetical protein
LSKQRPCAVPLEDLVAHWEAAEAERSPDTSWHIATCTGCQERLAYLSEMAELARGADLLEPPPWVVARAVRIAARPRAEAPRRPRLLHALLVPWSGRAAGGLAAAGQRRGPAAGAQMLFNAEGVDIDLRIVEAGQGAVRVLGQIFVDDAPGGQPARIHLVAGEEARTCEADEHGDFTLGPVPRGTYQLRAQYGDLDVLIDPLIL